MAYLKSVENVITLGKLIGLLFLFCLPLLSILFLKTKRKGFEYLVYYIGYSLRGTTVSVATYPLTVRSIRGGTLGWNIEIYSTPTNQFDWSVSRAYVINIYIYVCLSYVKSRGFT